MPEDSLLSMFTIVTVPPGASDLTEQVGTKPKFWFKDATGNKVLFKEGFEGSGENWAEKLAAEICTLLEVPHATYELALWRGRKGVITPTFVAENGRLVLGNELLSKVVQQYQDTRSYLTRQHTVSTVMAFLRRPVIGLPKGFKHTDEINNAGSLFVGYLLLDALIGNQDRHHENWGLIFYRDNVSLAPTFDHASGFGRNEADEFREYTLSTKDRGSNMEAYTKRARSALFRSAQERRPLLTIEAFSEAARLDERASRFWLSKLANTEPVDYRRIIDQIPTSEMTDITKRFTMELIEVNKNRLLKQNP